jgi:hypothetical protein
VKPRFEAYPDLSNSLRNSLKSLMCGLTSSPSGVSSLRRRTPPSSPADAPVVFAHAAVLSQPGERPLDHPSPPGQHHREGRTWRGLLVRWYPHPPPRGTHDTSTLRPNAFSTQSSLPLPLPLSSRRPTTGEKGARTAPLPTPPAAPSHRRGQRRRGRVDLGLQHQTLLRVYQNMALLAPFHLLGGVVASFLAAYTPVVLTLWLSTIPAPLG